MEEGCRVKWWGRNDLSDVSTRYDVTRAATDELGQGAGRRGGGGGGGRHVSRVSEVGWCGQDGYGGQLVVTGQLVGDSVGIDTRLAGLWLTACLGTRRAIRRVQCCAVFWPPEGGARLVGSRLYPTGQRIFSANMAIGKMFVELQEDRHRYQVR